MRCIGSLESLVSAYDLRELYLGAALLRSDSPQGV
jgi:hypothetical protein